MIQSVYFVYGLGFGDEGKGSIVDSICMTARNPIVIRYSGGQQCGHNVVINDELSHIHSSFGAGTLRGIPSYFTDDCTIYPASITREAEVLASKGIDKPVLHVHPLAKVTTPFDVAYGRLREKAVNHGSVGIGHGSTMHRHLKTGHKLHAIDLLNKDIHTNKLVEINRYYIDLIVEKDYSMDEYAGFLQDELEIYLDSCDSHLLNVTSPADMPFMRFRNDFSTVTDIIFEGSQGTLLDMDHGIFPNVTYSNTTVKNALNFFRSMALGFNKMHFIGVTRAYTTRHGEGWMPDNDGFDLANSVGETNFNNEFQGHLRVAAIDYNLIDHANAINDHFISTTYKSGVEKYMAVTCIDHLEDFNYEGKIDRKMIYRNSPISKELNF